MFECNLNKPNILITWISSQGRGECVRFFQLPSSTTGNCSVSCHQSCCYLYQGRTSGLLKLYYQQQFFSLINFDFRWNVCKFAHCFGIGDSLFDLALPGYTFQICGYIPKSFIVSFIIFYSKSET